ncbi:MAG: hypothetical protein Q7S57_00930 [bacterium]|nr:hypothetical protein [bacterium]
MKIDFKEIKKKSTISNFFIMAIGALICLVVAVVLVGGFYFLLSYETERLDGTSGVDAKMPSLDKGGLNYFISRQKQRSLLNVPVAPLPTASPVTNKKI